MGDKGDFLSRVLALSGVPEQPFRLKDSYFPTGFSQVPPRFKGYTTPKDFCPSGRLNVAYVATEWSNK